MKTVNIKGKEYVMVNERIKHFRGSGLYDYYSLESEIVYHENGEIIIKAIIKNENDVVMATGLAHEVKGEGMINKTSYVENCETSAWGRALGNLGIGIDASIASAEEVGNAIKQQGNKEEDTRSWLNPGTKEWKNAIINNATLDEVKNIYRISKKNEELYLNR